MRGAIEASRTLRYSTVAAALACWAAAAPAQTYPSKPIRYVIPFAAGTGNDIVGRLITDRLTRLWGQQVIVDNRRLHAAPLQHRAECDLAIDDREDPVPA